MAARIFFPVGRGEVESVDPGQGRGDPAPGGVGSPDDPVGPLAVDDRPDPGRGQEAVDVGQIEVDVGLVVERVQFIPAVEAAQVGGDDLQAGQGLGRLGDLVRVGGKGPVGLDEVDQMRFGRQQGRAREGCRR